MLGEDFWPRLQVPSAKGRVSSDQCIYGGVEGPANAQMAWDQVEIVAKVPRELESDIHLLANRMDECC